jgi:lipopolysaccharide transport system permease protein
MQIMGHLRNFWNFLGLSFALANAEFRLRNEGSYLGVLWYLINPLLMFSLLFFIFNDRLGGNIEYYSLYLLLGIIMFNFFQETTLESTKIIKQYGGVIKSINFNRFSLVLSLLIKRLYGHIFEIFLFGIFLILIKGNAFWLGNYIFIIILFSLFTYGFSLILSSIVVYFVDLDNIWAFFVRLFWFATPLFYAVEGQTRLEILNLFNPVYIFINLTREVVIYQTFPQFNYLLLALFYSLVFLFLGVIIFKILKNKFAEML